jgi:hypothetical protein
LFYDEQTRHQLKNGRDIRQSQLRGVGHRGLPNRIRRLLRAGCSVRTG